MLIKRFSFICVCLCSLIAVGQLDHQYWHFGSTNRGLFFDASNSYNVSVTTNSYTPYGNEGSTTVSSPTTGDLMFYSDGMTVVDNGHQAMPNGSGLLGHSSNFSSGKTCQVPGQCDQYYVFSVNTAVEVGTPGALRYSKVDMTLPGNGSIPLPKGDVAIGQKNILVANNVSESLEIVPKANSHDFWLLIGKQGLNSIDIYSITSTGIIFSNTYVIPIAMNNIVCIDHCQENGKVAMLSYQEIYPTLIADFDNLLGIFTGTIAIPGTPWGASTVMWQGTFDSEWSPDGSKLYLSKYRWGASSGGRLYQYDLNTPLVAPLMIHSVGPSNSAVARGIKLGPDGKIYMMYKPATGSVQFLHAVNNPNSSGLVCNFVPNVVNMGIDIGITHLFPDFLYYQNTLPQINDSIIEYNCQLPPTFIFNPLTGYTDNEADGLSFNVLSITGGTYNLVAGNIEITPTSVTAPVNLSIEYTDDYCFPLVDTFNISFEVIIGTGSLNLPDTLTACNNLMVDLDAGAGFNSYLWSTGEVTQIISVNVAGMYYVQTSDLVCDYSDSIFVSTPLSTPINFGPNINQCADSIQLSVGAFAGTITWSDGASGINNWVSTSQQYSVIAENGFGCLSYDTVDVILNPLPIIELGPDQHLCDGETSSLFATGFTTVLWNDFSTSDELIVSSTGIYFVEVSNIFSCTSTDTIGVTLHTPVQVFLGPDISLCETQVLLEDIGFVGDLNWSDGAIGLSNNVTISGQYSVIAQDIFGCESFDTINVFLAPIPDINLGNDTLVCAGEYELTVGGFSSILWSTGNTIQTILVNTAGIYSVEVINNFGCHDSDEVVIDIIVMYPIDFGDDIITCLDDPIKLSVQNTFGHVSWSTEQTSNTITVIENGTYMVSQLVCGEIYGDTIDITFTYLDQVIYVPNAFTPDGNNVNNEFSVVLGDIAFIESYKLSIYDRWGGLLFYSEDPFESWSGVGANGLVQDGMYVYKLEILNYCLDNPTYVKFGHVVVLK